MTRRELGGSHENLSREEPPIDPSGRSFGLVFAGFFALISLFPVVRGDKPRLPFLAVALVFLALATLAPRVLQPASRVWLRFSLLLHSIVTPLLMGAIFFLVISPVALFFRVIRRDPMKRAFDPAAASYWVERAKAGTEPAGMRNQF